LTQLLKVLISDTGFCSDKSVDWPCSEDSPLNARKCTLIVGSFTQYWYNSLR